MTRENIGVMTRNRIFTLMRVYEPHLGAFESKKRTGRKLGVESDG